MARVISPPTGAMSALRQPLTAGEAQVLDVFQKHLPESWEIYVQPHLNGLRPDFVLIDPHRGIGVFEVKDWDLDAMTYRVEHPAHSRPFLTGNLGQGAFRIRDPFAQADAYRREIHQIYCPRLQRKAGFAAITAGVIFPNASGDRVNALLAPLLPASHEKYAHRGPITGQEALAAGDISAIFPEATCDERYIMTPALADDLHGWLTEPDFSVMQRAPLKLSDDQRRLATTRTAMGYRRIRGPAGSGKSLVLAARAAELANAGKSVLVVTFNITLWHYLRDMMVRGFTAPSSIQNVTLTHFHRWCKMTCAEAGREDEYADLFASKPTGDALDRILREEIPALAALATADPDVTRYDAILVDEGQDYHPEWWGALRKVLNEGGEMLLVADRTQDVYGTAGAWTDEAMTGAGFTGAWAQLSGSYRTPPAVLPTVQDFARRFLPPDTIDLAPPAQTSMALDPATLRWVQAGQGQAARLCKDEILALMRQTGRDTANADITFLCDDMKIGAEVVKELEGYRVRAVHTFGDDQASRAGKMAFWMGDARVKATTLHSFKGWEARLIVLHVANGFTPESRALIYAGLTRLKSHPGGSWLTVVCNEPELRDWGMAWPDSIDRSNEAKPVFEKSGGWDQIELR